jgi:hypothetical protein
VCVSSRSKKNKEEDEFYILSLRSLKYRYYDELSNKIPLYSRMLDVSAERAGSSSSGTSIPQLKITAGAIMECLYVLNVTSF